MNQPPSEEPELRAEPWLAEALDELRPRARPGLRASLRASFLARGAEAPDTGAGVARPPHLSRAPRGPRPPRAPRTRRPALGRRSLLAALAASAAAAAALVFARPTATPRVRLVASSVSDLTLDGTGVPLAELEERLLAGAVLRNAENAVRLRLDDVALIELAPHTELTLHPWSARDSEARLVLTRGGVRVVTAPDFAPRRLTVAAPQAEVGIVGTEFGVDVIDGIGTCVCCTHGSVVVRAPGHDGVETLAAGEMSFCFSSGAEPMLGPVKEDHAAAVTALRRFEWP